jgi:dihydrofolate synthase/folylpolyglutamate synthase
MTYPDAIEFLYKLRLFGTKLGLENARELARLNGNPHEELPFIHVAGTNGKGSTCAMLESIYRAEGLKVGLFISPHLVSFTERIQVNRDCIPEEDVARLTLALIESLGGHDTDLWPFRPTFFEFVTIMALVYFREQNCELIIWETGMGGRLDATNIVTPLASVITNIQHDHQHWLGHTLKEIAGEKAGIIKPGVPVITATDQIEALEVIRETAKMHNAPLIQISENEKFAGQFADLLQELPLLGAHQKKNAILALAVCCALSERITVRAEAVRHGLKSVSWPGRLQLIPRGQTEFLLDGAHNPDGAATLAIALKEYFPDRKATVILGLFRDKAWREMCDVLAPLAWRLLLVPISSERSADPAEVQSYCSEKWPQTEIVKCENLAEAITNTQTDRFVVIAGSLHLIGEALELLHATATQRSERSLNEWDAANARR